MKYDPDMFLMGFCEIHTYLISVCLTIKLHYSSKSRKMFTLLFSWFTLHSQTPNMCMLFFFELHCEAHSFVLKNTEAKMLINNAAKECYRNKFYSNIWLKVLWMFVGVCKFISTYNLMYICLYQRATVFFL